MPLPGHADPQDALTGVPYELERGAVGQPIGVETLADLGLVGTSLAS